MKLRFQAFSASQVRLVPGGLDPLQHWQLGQAVTSPLDQEVAIPDDCNFACRRCVSPDFSKWLRLQQRVVDRCLRELQPIDHVLRSMQHPDAQLVAGHVSPGTIDCVGRSVYWPDRESPFIPVVGMHGVNEIPPHRDLWDGARAADSGFSSIPRQRPGLA